MKIFLTSLLGLLCMICHAQSETFDILTYTPPAGWSREAKGSYVMFTKIDNAAGTWCQIAVYKSMTTLGSVDLDFKHEWDDLVVKNYKPATGPQQPQTGEAEGWKIMTAGSTFNYNNQECLAFLTTFSGFGVFTSILASMNSDDFTNDVVSMVGSVKLTKPSAAQNTVTVTAPVVAKSNASNVVQSSNPNSASCNAGFKFTSTNWDDGWVSVAMEDWVQVTKGNITVLLHYPKEGAWIAADPEPVVNNGWNVLVAPRYSNLRNYKVAQTITEYQRGYLSTGTLTDNATGKDVFVAFFGKAGMGWMEFITPDKNTFVQFFKTDPDLIRWDSSLDTWNPLMAMYNYNRFAIAESDLKGKWTSDYSGMLQMYNTVTGNYAGMNVHQSSDTFDFKGNTYKWKLIAVNGMVGNLTYQNAESEGVFNVPNNWQVHFSKIESKPVTYHAYWSCVKGGRLLWMKSAAYSGGSFSSYGKAAQ